jgi:hypothetical protein
MILVGTECVEGKDYLDSIKECYDQSVLFLFYSSSFIFFFLFSFLGVRRGQGLDGRCDRGQGLYGRSIIYIRIVYICTDTLVARPGRYQRMLRPVGRSMVWNATRPVSRL